MLARVPWWVGDALAIAIVLTTSFLGGPIGPGIGGPAGDRPGGAHPFGGVDQSIMGLLAHFAIVLVACAMVPLRRRWPIPIFAASLLLYCTTVVLREPAFGVGVVVILTAYSVGARVSRRHSLLAGGIATVITAALSLTSAEFGVIDVRVFQFSAGIAVAVAIGSSSRSYREFVAAANERAERAEQTRDAVAQQRVAEERLRIAQDLHDTVAHQISVISLNSGAASRALESNPERAQKALHTIRTSSREVLSEIGNLLTYLRTDGESVSAPQPSANDVDALTSRMRDAGLQISLTASPDWHQVSEATGRVLYRVVQEGLTNAHKHGSAGTVSVSIVHDGGEVIVSISNPASPSRPAQPEMKTGGLGLTGLRERVAAIGGTVTNTLNGEFVLEARLPNRREDSV